MNQPTSPLAADRGALLDEWLATRAEIARLEGHAADLLASRAALFDEDAKAAPLKRDAMRRSMIAEYSAAGRLARGSIEAAFADAEALAAAFPGLHGALRAGIITAPHAHVLIAAAEPLRDAVRNGELPEEIFAAYEAAVLVVAEQDSPARSRVHAKQVAAVLCGETLRERHERAAGERCITVRPLEDGLALLTAVLPEIYAVAIMDRLTQLAGAIAVGTRSDIQVAMGAVFGDPAGEAVPPADGELDPYDLDPADPRREAYELSILAGTTYVTDPEHADDENGSSSVRDRIGCGREAGIEFVAGDGRTRRRIEADAFIDLLLAGRPSEALGTGLDRITATVQVTIAASTLIGEDDRLAELDGRGPLHPDIARRLAAEATGWNRLFLDPGGMITKTDRYTPTTSMKRFLRARDQRCRFPGCHTPALRCDIDHNHDHAQGGATSLDNLACFCRAHHPLKHPDIDEEHRWYARQLPDGSIEWISPLRRRYQDPAPRRVMFV
ncbi:HNH endonuclease signature motif containing protein [Microbacterium sp. 22242]|uniref:HNH endonuclease signature motif containing protein n=1 Tax=Microbacterium sp. 22242 TaxID=3453896 RepID=UPI003F8768AF